MRIPLLACAFLAVMASPAGWAQAQGAILRGADGHPDLQGSWESRWLTPLERMPGADAVSVDADKARTLIAGYHEGMAK